jgi:hypothetical protein
MRLIIVVSAAVVVHLALALGFIACRHSADIASEDEIRALAKQWEAEDDQRLESEKEELAKEFGAGELDLLAYNPAVDIETILRKLFDGVTPDTYVVEVKVDRFSEFTVLVNMFQMPEKPQLAGYLKQVFSRVDPNLVYQVAFYVKDQFIVVDRTQLLQIEDWKNANEDEIIEKCL